MKYTTELREWLKFKKKKFKPTVVTAGGDWSKDHSFIASANSKTLQALWRTVWQFLTKLM